MNDRVVRMTKYRIDGNEAYKLNKERNKWHNNHCGLDLKIQQKEDYTSG
jgi:hypothetical protein